jgi:hypothetical protein
MTVNVPGNLGSGLRWIDLDNGVGCLQCPHAGAHTNACRGHGFEKPAPVEDSHERAGW